MKFLLDTHVFLWMAAEPEKLSVKAEECIWVLIAQSRYEKMGMISADDIVAKYETRIVW